MDIQKTYSIKDIQNTLNISYTVARKKLLELIANGSKSVVLINRSIRVLNFNQLVVELNMDIKKYEKLCEKNIQSILKKEESTTRLTSITKAQEYAEALEKLLYKKL